MQSRKLSSSLLWRLTLGSLLVGASISPSPCPAQTPSLQAATDPFQRAPTVLQARKLRGLRAEVASLVLLAEPGGEIAVEGLALPLPTTEPKAEVRLFLEIDGASLLEHNQDDPARIEVYAYALDGTGQVADYLAEVFAVAVHENGEAIWQGGLKLYGSLHLPAGQYRLRLLVRNFSSKAAGLRELALHVPPAGDTPDPLVFFDAPQTRDAWMPVRPWSDSAAQTETPYPFVAAGDALRPAAQPVAIAERRTELWVYARSLPAGALGASAEWQTERQPVTTTAEVLERYQTTGSAELVKLALTPPALTSGNHRLKLVLSGGTQQPRAAEVAVLVLDSATRERDLLWTDLRWLISAASGPAVATGTDPKPVSEERTSRRRANRKRVARLAQDYRAALNTSIAGAAASARSALIDFETQVLASNERGGLAALLAAELATAEELAAADLESLIPLMTLHDEIYLVYRQRRMFSLVFHTRSLIEQLADLYALRGGSQGSRVVTARVLANLAGHLQDSNLPAGSRRLFERSLEYDPNGRTALLGLAASFEKYGDYGRARFLLETLTNAHPRFSEGMLRYANNLARTGDLTRARELWSKVLELDGPPWVRTLAYQELARGWMGTGNLSKAAELLERSIAETPEEGSTRLLLAYVYDRLQEPKKAFDLVGSAVESQRDSARKSYDSWPTVALDADRRELESAAATRLPTLRRLLGSAGAEKAEKEVGE